MKSQIEIVEQRRGSLTVNIIPATNGSDVTTIEPTATLKTAIRILVEHQIGGAPKYSRNDSRR